ncbi:hypothetical protein Bcop_1712 [Bacteroides coprosuis DSM 18011]|uniref:Transposase n=1 Tax=Bacteroides coprosuis DSM 18011 TaxID=679937 RepID=F3ZR96_9BACE|nr:hypothetical protein [Bacteroides coprosuis]EGJ71904.1 hypothetical protein Bcop_1712 [Bacteroides coprosuis DSM 18011]
MEKKQLTPEEEQAQLQLRIKQLEKELEHANLQKLALNTLIDIAEKSEGIQIRNRKKTKPPKS